MKTIKFILIISLGVLLSNCEDYLDINSDPNYPQEATAEVIFPPMFYSMARGEMYDTRYIGMYIQNIASHSANYRTDIHGYFTGSDAIGEKWRSTYYGIGTNIDLILRDAKENNKWWSAGAGMAIRAWAFQTATDVYGEIIFSEAFKPNTWVFNYDNQETVYSGVVEYCNQALDYLDKQDDSNTLAIGDLVYHGDAEKWKKFVYGILARNANHISNKVTYDPDLVVTYVDKALASNTDNFYIPFANLASNDSRNFLGPRRNNFSARKQAAFSVNLLNGNTFPGVIDPRLPLMFNPSPDGVFRGIVNGAGDPSRGTDQGVPTWYNNYIFFDNADYPIMTFSEMQFIKSEALFHNGDKTGALQAYVKGITAHMDFVGVSAVDQATYLTSAAVAQDITELDLSDIMLQKYIALWGHGVLESWTDLRRYEYSDAIYTGISFPDPLWDYNNGELAYRCRPRYNSEYKWNIEALESIGATAPEYHTKKPWFILP
ncbi:MAG: SusD/RagB family nutrient-binding outer membrane lipoprotein [Cyclobacteriaceae bacterium]|nr:SusD/RagB family nutrient-binding outer membrane lipoprotein [Cyclobacteriaceae bacterium]